MNFQSIISSEQPVLVDFYATWCEPCKWVEPVLDEIIKHFSGKIVLHKIDIDLHPEIARQHHILSVPTMVLFRSGEEVWRMRGFDTAPVLKKILVNYL